MPIGPQIQAWRKQRGLSVTALAGKANLQPNKLEAIENGELDPSVSILEALAQELFIPTAWLHFDPSAFKLLLADPDEDGSEWLHTNSPDPVTARILTGAHQDRDLYVLLTTLLQNGDPKLVRAAEVNLRSLVKQAQKATLPWESRIPGHFEPPSD